MKVNFRDICGNSYNLQISNDAKVSDACKLLSEQLGIQQNQVFLVSTNEDTNFYQDNQKMCDVIKENPDFVIFLKYLYQSQYIWTPPENTESNENTNNVEEEKTDNDDEKIGIKRPVFDHYLKVPNPRMFNTLLSVRRWDYHGLYDDYSIVLNDTPPDFEEKVKQITELGYSVDDIKEALRTTNYDVPLSIHYLMYHHRHNDAEEVYNEYDSENEEYDNSDFEYNQYFDNHFPLANENENDENKEDLDQNNENINVEQNDDINKNDENMNIKGDVENNDKKDDGENKESLDSIDIKPKSAEEDDDHKNNCPNKEQQLNGQKQSEIPNNPFYCPYYHQDKKQEQNDSPNYKTSY